MWPDSLFGFLITLGVGMPISMAIALPIAAPIETKRFLKMVRARIGWVAFQLGSTREERRALRGRRRLSIDMVVELGSDVDMKWWQEQYDKLVRSIPTDSWAKSVERALATPATPTSAELNTSLLAFAKVWDAQKDLDDWDLTTDLEEHVRVVGRALSSGMVTVDDARAALYVVREADKCLDCEYQEVHTYASQYVTRHKTSACQRCMAKEIWS
ncbi:membrane protein [Microbacterium phage Pavlo]|nr:membrane protein [Microbacterium phage Pavlo]